MNKHNINTNDLPPEYTPWLNELAPFVNGSLENIDKKIFNKDENHNARILLALFVIGVVNYYQRAKNLTFGQHRYLAINILVLADWDHETASYLYDYSDNLAQYMPELADDGNDSLDAGFRAGRAYFEDNDICAGLMPKVKSLQWKKKGWLIP